MSDTMKNTKPIEKSIKAKAHTPQYKIHKYFARRPYNVFRNLIEHYSKPKDIVLDVFCGGGVTVYEGTAIDRKVVGVDLNPLATFITEMQLKQLDPEGFKQFAIEILQRIESDYSHVYKMPNMANEIMEWTEWAYCVSCPYCGSEIILNEENKAKNKDGNPKNGFYVCSNKNCSEGLKGVKRTDCVPNGSLALRAKTIKGNLVTFTPNHSTELQIFIDQLESDLISSEMTIIDKEIPLDWDRTHEDKLNEKGIYSFKDFFTKRNYALNIVIFNKLKDLKEQANVSDSMIDLLYFTFSASLRHTNNMTRVTENWENGNPTSMDKHAYWLPNQFVETNIFHQWRKKINSMVKALKYNEEELKQPVTKFDNFSHLEKASKGYMILNQSSSELPIPDQSVDVIITDPPYGSNVQYNELSSFWNIWYEAYTGNPINLIQEKEAVMNRKKNFVGSKSLAHYEDMLYKVFLEGNRVLKNNGYLVFTFNNKNVKVWFSLLRAAARAGFTLPLNGVLFQDYIESYKNTAHLRFEGNIQGDFIYSFQKCLQETHSTISITEDFNLEVKLKELLTETVQKIFEEKEKCNTAELYQGVFSGIVHFMMEVAILTIADESIIKEVESKSDQYIDQLLKSQLEFKNDYWYLKEEASFV